MYHLIVDLPRSVPSQGEAKSGTTYLRPFDNSSIVFNYWSHSQFYDPLRGANLNNG